MPKNDRDDGHDGHGGHRDADDDDSHIATLCSRATRGRRFIASDANCRRPNAGAEFEFCGQNLMRCVGAAALGARDSSALVKLVEASQPAAS